jgi:hypothetical protein
MNTTPSADDYELPPVETYLETGSTAAPKSNGQAQPAGAEPGDDPRNAPLNWEDLEHKDPPSREWIVPHWIPAAHTTLLTGRGGIGKTLLAQHIGAALALGFEYIEPLDKRCVLMWAGEDDADELWRRQRRISSHMKRPLSDLAERFYLHSYVGTDITLAAPSFGSFQPTAMLAELKTQVADYKAEVVILDNAARIYGGSENDRHAVTTFLAWLQRACAPAAILLLAHPAKALGSEYSGNTAWEFAVRARLYLNDRPPEPRRQDDDDEPPDDAVRYLARRKANYSALDLRRFTMADGVLIPDALEPNRPMGRPSGEFLKDIVRRAMRTLGQRNLTAALGSRAENYLPKLAKQYDLLETASVSSFTKAMSEMVMAGELVNEKIGQYANRTPKNGLVLK